MKTFFVSGKPMSKGSFVPMLHPKLKQALASPIVQAAILSEGIELTGLNLCFSVPQSSNSLKKWEQSVFEVASEELKLYSDVSPVTLDLKFFLERPKWHFKSDGNLKISSPQHPIGRTGDFDKLTRACADALHTIAYKDDCQVVKATIEKKFAGRNGPGVEIGIEEIREEGLFG